MPYRSLTAPRHQLERSCRDFYQQSLNGPAFYVVACIVVAATDRGLTQQPWLVGLFAVALAGLGVLRWLHRPPAITDSDERMQRWYRRHWQLLFVGAGVWTTFNCLTLWQLHTDDG